MYHLYKNVILNAYERLLFLVEAQIHNTKAYGLGPMGGVMTPHPHDRPFRCQKKATVPEQEDASSAMDTLPQAASTRLCLGPESWTPARSDHLAA